MKLITNKNGKVNKGFTVAQAQRLSGMRLTVRQARELARHKSVATMRRVNNTSNVLVFHGQSLRFSGTEYQARKWAAKQQVYLLPCVNS